MIQWVKDDFRGWGYRIFHTPNGWPPVSVLKRIEQYHIRLTGGKHDYVPKGIGMGEYVELDQVIKNMPDYLREVVHIKYACQGARDRDRWEFLGLKRTDFYSRLNLAHVIWETVGEKPG